MLWIHRFATQVTPKEGLSVSADCSSCQLPQDLIHVQRASLLEHTLIRGRTESMTGGDRGIKPQLFPPTVCHLRRAICAPALSMGISSSAPSCLLPFPSNDIDPNKKHTHLRFPNSISTSAFRKIRPSTKDRVTCLDIYYPVQFGRIMKNTHLYTMKRECVIKHKETDVFIVILKNLSCQLFNLLSAPQSKHTGKSGTADVVLLFLYIFFYCKKLPI